MTQIAATTVLRLKEMSITRRVNNAREVRPAACRLVYCRAATRHEDYCFRGSRLSVKYRLAPHLRRRLHHIGEANLVGETVMLPKLEDKGASWSRIVRLISILQPISAQ